MKIHNCASNCTGEMHKFISNSPMKVQARSNGSILLFFVKFGAEISR